jgi:hypothetical protein
MKKNHILILHALAISALQFISSPARAQEVSCAETFRTTRSGCQFMQGLRFYNGEPTYLGTASDGPINDRALALLPIRWMLELIKTQSSPALTRDEDAAKVLSISANYAFDWSMATPKVAGPEKRVIELILALAKKNAALCDLGRGLSDIYAFSEVRRDSGTPPDGCFGLMP